MKREAISFGRFSQAKQEEGKSVERQRKAYREVCQRYSDRVEPSERYGFGVFFGKGESGYHGRHLDKGGSLAKLLQMLQAGEINPAKSVLVIEAFDRLSRLEPDLAMGLLSDIVRSGCVVVVHTPDMWVDRSALGGPMFIAISAMLQLAHAESKQKAERIGHYHRSNREARKGHGLSVGPGWLKWDGKGWKLVPEHAKTVRRIFEEFLGGSPAVTIARRLNEDKVKSWGWRNKLWTDHHVRALLAERTVLGEYQPKVVQGKRRVAQGQPLTGFYPAVVTEETWYRAQGVRLQRTKQRGRRAKAAVNLFRGIMFDAVTRTNMVMCKSKSRSGATRHYLVSARAKMDGSHWVTISYRLVEMAFLVFIKGPKLRTTRPDTLEAEIEAAESVIAEATAKLKAIEEDEGDEEDLIPLTRRYSKRRKEAEALLETLKRQASAKPNEDVEDCKTLAHQWEEASGGDDTPPDEFKERLASRIRAVVSEIWILVEQRSRKDKEVILQVHLREGGVRHIRMQTGKEFEAEPFDGAFKVDLRKWGEI